MKCWVCGKKEATTERYGYPVCNDCYKRFDDELDPEMLEEVVIESFKIGRLVSYDELQNKKS